MGETGPLLVHNCTQASARVIMAEALASIEAEGYLPVLVCHDEVVTETPDDVKFMVDRLNALLSAVPQWAPGLPLAAGGFEALRYRKD